MTDFMREVLPIVLAAGIATPLGMLAMWAIEKWFGERYEERVDYGN